jgi:hypothetical protein
MIEKISPWRNPRNSALNDFKLAANLQSAQKEVCPLTFQDHANASEFVTIDTLLSGQYSVCGIMPVRTSQERYSLGGRYFCCFDQAKPPSMADALCLCSPRDSFPLAVDIIEDSSGRDGNRCRLIVVAYDGGFRRQNSFAKEPRFGRTSRRQRVQCKFRELKSLEKADPCKVYRDDCGTSLDSAWALLYGIRKDLPFVKEVVKNRARANRI